MLNEIEKFTHENFIKILVSIALFLFFVIFGYLYFNKTGIDNRDYSLDKSIEDNFVLPPQTDEKYLHFKEGNNLTVINYYSLDCPYCRKLFFQEKKLIEKFGDKVNFAFRDKPLSSYPLSYQKALIKECVYLNNGKESKKNDEEYFKFSEEVFKNYKETKDNDWVKEIALKYIGKEQLENCLVDENLKQKILGFRAKADASQIFWTPTIVLFKDGVEVERVEKVWAEIYEKILEKYVK